MNIFMHFENPKNVMEMQINTVVSVIMSSRHSAFGNSADDGCQ